MSIEIDGTWYDEYTGGDLIREWGEQTGDSWNDEDDHGTVHHHEIWSFGSERFNLCWEFAREIVEDARRRSDCWEDELPYDNGTCHIVELRRKPFQTL